MLKKNHIVFYLSVAVLVIVVGIWSYIRLINPHYFPVETVTVTGEYQHLSEPQVEQVILPYARQGLFAFPARELQHELIALPWVATANIRRSWPATMTVTLTEKKPVAIWNNVSLLTAEGVLFTPDKKTIPEELPHLYGPTNRYTSILEAFLKIDQSLVPLNLQIEQFDVSPRDSWQVVLNNKIIIIIGKESQMERLQRFIDLYPQIIGDKVNRVYSVDLRYPNGMAVTWKKR